MLSKELIKGENTAEGDFMSIEIVTDSTSDISQEEAKELKIQVVPLGVNFGEEQFLDGININGEKFYARLVDGKTFPKTSQPAPASFAKIFREAMNKGDEVLYLGCSSGLSGTFNAARLAKDEVGYSKVYVFDSLTSIQGLYLMVHCLAKKRDEGASKDELISEASYISNHLKIVSAIDTLSYLRKGGRLSLAASMIGNLISLKAMVDLNKEGKIRVYGKCIGLRMAMKLMLLEVKHSLPDDRYPFSFGYTDKPDNMKEFKDKVMAEFPKYSLYMSQIGPAIGSHIGPGGFDLAFVSEKERK
jgi:DegV family protein with EDD domain